MKTIITPTDFSAIAENAALYAADMAIAVNADLLLVHVVTIPLSIAEAPVPSDIFEVMTSEAVAEIKKLQEKLQVHTNDKLTITTHVVVDDLVDDLIDLASQKDTFAIVMGVKGAESKNNFWFGSNTISVMHKLNHPVITVPGDVSFKKIAKVGLACDLEDASLKLPVAYLERLHTEFNCELHILNVTKENEKVDSDILYESIALQNDLKKFHPQFHFLVNENIEVGVAEFVKRVPIDLLMVMPKEYGFFESLFHKSVSKEIMTHSKVPILSLHPVASSWSV